MKNITLAFVVSVVSCGLTIATYEFYIRPQTPHNVREIIYRDQNPNAKYTRQPNAGEQFNTESFTEAAQLSRPAVVHIQSKSNSEYDIFDMGSASGSGVIMTDDGYIITNNHVIEGSKEVKVTLNDRRSFSAKVIGTDPSTDLAVIRIKEGELKGKKLATLEWGNSDIMQVGEWVLAVGNPFNLTSTVTAGIISAKGRNIDILEGNYSVESFIQTDAAVNPGNSGGALVDVRDGKLIGINTAIITKSGRYEGYSFAVPANLVKKVMTDLIEFGEVKRGFLGVTIKDVDNKIADANKMDNLEGVFVEKVSDNGAAATGGLKKGDVIVKVNGVKVSSAPELQEQVALFRPDNTITVEYLREGKIFEADIILKDQNNSPDVANSKKTGKKFKNKSSLLEDLGMKAETVSVDLQKKLNIKGGVMVKSLTDDSPLQSTNMENAFIITSVNEELVTSLQDFIDLIFAAEGEITIGGFYEKYEGEYTYVFSK